MERLTIKTPSDVLSFLGHTLGFWPKESLVCITLTRTASVPPSGSISPAKPGRNFPTHGMLDSTSFPSDDDCHALIAHLQFPAIRDRLIADIPGVDEPMQDVLFAQTYAAPKWSRIEWA